MARRARGDDDRLLEAVSLDGTPLPAAAESPVRVPRANRSRVTSRGRHIAPWVGAATIALVAAVVLPVRAKVAVAELGTVARGWSVARGAIEQRQVVMSRLEQLATP